MSDHRLFPLGLNCAHCERWHTLANAIQHAEQLHADCKYCQMEMQLAQSILAEAGDALVKWVERRQHERVTRERAGGQAYRGG